MNGGLRADTISMAILASLFGAVAVLSAAHIALTRLRWIEWDNRAANSHAVLDPRPPGAHHPELAELARRIDPDSEDAHHPQLSPFAQAAGWRPGHGARRAGRQRTVSSRR